MMEHLARQAQSAQAEGLLENQDQLVRREILEDLQVRWARMARMAHLERLGRQVRWVAPQGLRAHLEK